MCLLLHMKPGAERLMRREVKDFARHNPNGWGAIWRDDAGVIQTVRGMFTFKQQWRFIQRHIAGREALLHWRFATNSATGEANCHPFPLGDSGVYLMHNGILPIEATATKSDTYLYSELITPLFAEALAEKTKAAIMSGLASYADKTGNKLALWGGQITEPQILGTGGREHKGRWYSNDYAWDSPFGFSSYVYDAADWEAWDRNFKPSKTRPPLIRLPYQPADKLETVCNTLPWQGGAYVKTNWEKELDATDSSSKGDYDVRLRAAKDALDRRLSWVATAQAIYDAIEDVSRSFTSDEAEAAILAEDLFTYAEEEIGIEAILAEAQPED